MGAEQKHGRLGPIKGPSTIEVNLTEILTPSQRFIPLAEHTVQHSALTCAFSASELDDQTGRNKILFGDNYQLTALLTELAHRGVLQNGLGLMLPQGDMMADALVASQVMLGTKLGELIRSKTVQTPSYLSSGGDTIYIRDTLVQGTVKMGSLAIASTSRLSTTPGEQKRSATQAYAIGRLHGFKPTSLPILFEGGNHLATIRHNLTLHDSVVNNARFLDKMGQKYSGYEEVRDAMEKVLGNTKPLVVLDSFGPEQLTYHLDLLMTAVCGLDRREYFVLSSLPTAVEILEGENLVRNGKVINEEGLLEYFSRNTKSDLEIQGAMASDFAKIRKGLSSETKHAAITPLEFLQRSFESRNRCVRDLVTNLQKLIKPDSVSKARDGLAKIRARMTKLGYSYDQFIECPGLYGIGVDSAKTTYNLSDPITQAREFPIYCPANGVQFNPATGEKMFITMGGLGGFDEYTRHAIESVTGLEVIQPHTSLVQGKNLAGIHCMFHPIFGSPLK